MKDKFCPDCARNRLTTKEFIREARKVHGRKYDYSKVIYRNVTAKLTIICPKHGVFLQNQSSHLSGKGCPHCVTKRYSKIAIKWLKHIEQELGIKIQHAENGGEYYISEASAYADGYHKPSNTIFEFHGDAYHGNLKRYASTARPNPFSELTTKQLNVKTVRREKLLRSLGYTVVSMWESDFKKLLRSKICQNHKSGR